MAMEEHRNTLHVGILLIYGLAHRSGIWVKGRAHITKRSSAERGVTFALRLTHKISEKALPGGGLKIGLFNLTQFVEDPFATAEILLSEHFLTLHWTKITQNNKTTIIRSKHVFASFWNNRDLKHKYPLEKKFMAKIHFFRPKTSVFASLKNEDEVFWKFKGTDGSVLSLGLPYGSV